jgi:molecular chaperone DnaJ
MSEDLYTLLDLNKSASDTEIKKAYRRLARKYHPDVNKDAGAEDKFKKIQKAYDVLSNPQKKSQYDQFGVTDDNYGGAGAGGYGDYSGFSSNFDGSFDDIFDVFFGGSKRRSGSRSGPKQGEDLRYDLEISLEEAAKGVSKNIDIFHLSKCSSCKGSGAKDGAARTSCSYCNGTGQVRREQRTFLGSFSQVTTCGHCKGTGSMIKNPCPSCAGRGVEKAKKNIKIDIPAGVDSGTKLRVTKEGNYGEGGGPPGDLYVYIRVREHRYFHRQGDDIFIELEIPATQAILGTEVEVPIIEGSAILRIGAGTQSETVFRLKGKGIPHVRGYGKGDQYVKIKVKIPVNITSEEKKLISELSKIRQDDKTPKSIFQNIKQN